MLERRFQCASEGRLKAPLHLLWCKVRVSRFGHEEECRVAKAPARCIFCEGASGTSLSREHVFPDWLRQIFPRKDTDTHTHGTISWTDATMSSPAITTRRRQGQAGTRSVRVVCKKCNNGWLSVLEERTKPLLRELVQASLREIGSEDQNLLAVWAAKTIMTGEYIERERAAVPQEQRCSLKDTLSVPDGWWIWVAGSQGLEWRTGMYHFSAKLNVSPIDLETPGPLNIQCTTIGIGTLLLHAISTTAEGHSFALVDPDAADLKPIWPPVLPAIRWPPGRLLRDEDIDVIKTNLERAYYKVRTPGAGE